MKKIRYPNSIPIDNQIAFIYANDPKDHHSAYELALLYVLYKSGLFEDSLPLTQFNAAFEAFLEVMTIIEPYSKEAVSDK